LDSIHPEVKHVVAFVKNRAGDALGARDSHGEPSWKATRASDKAFIHMIAGFDQSLSKVGYETIAIAVTYGDARADANMIACHFVGLMLDPPLESLRQVNITS